MRTLFLHLETIPTHNKAVKALIDAHDEYRFVVGIGQIEPDLRLKDAEKIAESIRMAAREQAWRDTSLDGWNGHIAIIGFAIDNEPVESITTINVMYDRVRDDEGDMAVSDCYVDVSSKKEKIEAFFDYLGHDAFLVVGHRVRRFDIMFLWQRCIVLGIPVPFLSRAKDSTRSDKYCINDTSEMTGTTLSSKPFGPSLQHLCEALDIQTKGDITGANVWDQITGGNIVGVAEYCRWDVRQVRSVWRRLKEMQSLNMDKFDAAGKAAA